MHTKHMQVRIKKKCVLIQSFEYRKLLKICEITNCEKYVNIYL